MSKNPSKPKEQTGNVEVVRIYATRTIAKDGTITLKPLDLVVSHDGWANIHEAAEMLDMSERNVQYLCSIGDFKTANKPGRGTNAQWRIARWEVLQRRNPPKD